MMHKTTIEQITCDQITSPLKRPFITAMHQVNENRAIRVRIVLANGLVGVGTATPNEKVTGETLTTLKQVMTDIFTPALLHQDVADWENLLTRVRTVIVNNTPAKAGFEIALYDLRRQLFGVSLTELLGGRPQPVQTDYTISIRPIPDMIAEARELIKQGFTALKLKLGTRPFKEDIQMVAQISATVGPDIRLRLDINQAWTVKQTLQAIQVWYAAGLPIDFIEQPVYRPNIAGMQAITAQSLIPIMADESVFSAHDALQVIHHQACDMVNIKLMKSGGLSEAEKINTICETAGIPCMLGCMSESEISIAAAAAFVAAHRNVHFTDLDSVFMGAQLPDPHYLTLHQDQLWPAGVRHD